MIPYLILIAVPAIVGMVGSKYNDTSKNNRTIIDIFFFLFLMLLILRNESVGVDLQNYKLFFEQYSFFSPGEIVHDAFYEGKEIGYMLLSRFISVFTDNFRMMIIVCGLMSVIPIWKMYRKEPDFGFLTIILFLNIAPFTLFFSGLRQAIAIAFVCIAYHFTKEKRFFPFLFAVFVGFLFHKSALIGILLYPIYHLRIKNKLYLLAFIPVIGIVYYYATPIFFYLAGFLSNNYVDRYLVDVQETGAYMVSLLLFLLLIYSFVIVDEEKMDDETVGLRNLLVLATILQLFSRVHTIAMRVNYYYLIFIPMLIPRIMRRTSDKNVKIMQISMIVFVVYFTYNFLHLAYTGGDAMHVFPYAFFWEQI